VKSVRIIIIIIERKDLGGVMSKDCNDTLDTVEWEKITRSSSGDEIANVNFLDIVHVLQNTVGLESRINSATGRRSSSLINTNTVCISVSSRRYKLTHPVMG